MILEAGKLKSVVAWLASVKTFAVFSAGQKAGGQWVHGEEAEGGIPWLCNT